MPALTIDQILARANTLASQIAAANVPDQQLSIVLVHLKRHRDVKASLTLLAELRRSPFARRHNAIRAQFQTVEENVRNALKSLTDWEEAAAILGWARRLVSYYSRGGHRS
jgi:hypothetical protein